MPQRQLFDQQRKPRLGEFGRLIAQIRHDVDGVVAVGVITAAGTSAENLAGEERLAVAVGAVKSGVADGLLIGRHAPLRGLRHDAGEQAETAQQHERALSGGAGA